LYFIANLKCLHEIKKNAKIKLVKRSSLSIVLATLCSWLVQ